MAFWNKRENPDYNPYMKLSAGELAFKERESIEKKDWRELQKVRIAAAMKWPLQSIVKEDITAENNIYGTVYSNPKAGSNRAILLIGGISGNRYALEPIARQLASYGFYCLSIDLPQHYINPQQLSLGAVSELITNSVRYLKVRTGTNRVGVLGHSLGAIGALFSMGGYTMAIEGWLSGTWKELIGLMNKRADIIAIQRAKTDAPPKNMREAVIQDYQKENWYMSKLMPIDNQIKIRYDFLKSQLYKQLTDNVKNSGLASSYAFVNPPKTPKHFLPAASLLACLPHKVIKSLAEPILHKPAAKVARKAGLTYPYVAETEHDKANWGFFKTGDAKAFIRYMVGLTTNADYIKLIEALANFKTGDEMLNFFSFYNKRYLKEGMPKLFIYTNNDNFAQTWLPGRTKLMHDYYSLFENSVIRLGHFGHIATNKPVGRIPGIRKIPMLLENVPWALTNDTATSWIMRFFDGTL